MELHTLIMDNAEMLLTKIYKILSKIDHLCIKSKIIRSKFGLIIIKQKSHNRPFTLLDNQSN